MKKSIFAAALITLALATLAVVHFMGTDALKQVKEVVELIFWPLTLATAGWGVWESIKGRRAAEAREAKGNQPISIVLVGPDGRVLILPYRILRKLLNRGEVPGVMGFYSGGRRFEIPGLADAFESGVFDAVINGTSDVLRIAVSQAEFDQFDLFLKCKADPELAAVVAAEAAEKAKVKAEADKARAKADAEAARKAASDERMIYVSLLAEQVTAITAPLKQQLAEQSAKLAEQAETLKQQASKLAMFAHRK